MIKKSKLSAKDLNMCAKIWDHTNEETADQILHELGVDYSYIESGSYMKADCANGFFSMKIKYQKMLLDEFENYDGNYNGKSETFNDMIFQVKNPKDMYQTELWWNNLDPEDKGEIFLNDGSNSFVDDNDCCSLKWNELEHHVQWFLHEVRMETFFPYVKIGHSYKVHAKTKPKNYKVTCWHCGNSDQKVLSFSEAFECTKCDELLWIGNGGYVEQVEGIYQ